MSGIIDILAEMASIAEKHGERVLTCGVDTNAYGNLVYTMKTVKDRSVDLAKVKRIDALRAELDELEGDNA